MVNLTESVAIPKALLKDLYVGLVKVDEALATIEELMDREGLERIHGAEGEYEKGDYVTIANSSEIKNLSSE
jgi:hypothetical protein